MLGALGLQPKRQFNRVERFGALRLSVSGRVPPHRGDRSPHLSHPSLPFDDSGADVAGYVHADAGIADGHCGDKLAAVGRSCESSCAITPASCASVSAA